MTIHPAEGDAPLRRGVVAVIPRADRLLVIRRSQTVAAPGAFCFPGGGIEGDESEQQALVRELREELGVVVQPQRRLWENVTPWRVHLAWWLAEFSAAASPVANRDEVESFHWHTTDEMLLLTGLLESNRQFLAALSRGEFTLADAK